MAETNQKDSSVGNGASTAEPYKVGKGKPPLNTQFKKGNKLGKGRPKGAKNIKTIVNEVLGAKVSAKINGKVVKISKTELAMHQLSNKAGAGDLKAIDKVIAMEERYGPQEDPAGPAPEEIVRDLDTLRDYLNLYDMFAEGGEEDG
jgi:hypothetical protein